MQILKKTDLKALEKASSMQQKELIQLLKDKGLTGRGGANFPTAQKWQMVYQTPSDTKYIICNSDEGEPGTFKDKFILTHNPELVIEGILIAAHAINCHQAYIYLRGEYDYLQKKLDNTIDKIKKKTRSKVNIDIILGAGAYVCGEETAIIRSIEGFRGQPSHKPPFPTVKGLWGKPTIINNVETLANVPLAIHYKDWKNNLRLYSLSGDVSKPGIYELPIGTRLKDLIDLGKPKKPIKAVYFGCFGGCMPYSKDIRLIPQDICTKECMLGSCTVIAVNDERSIIDLATNIAKFYEFESCGKCTPCREGTMQILAILENISLNKASKKDLDTLKELAEVIKETSFCGLGQTSTQHLLTALKHFKKEFEERCR